MSEDLVTLDITEGVADVRLNRANKYNSLIPEMFTYINQAFEKLNKAKEFIYVFLSGNGNGFCAGLDMSSFARMADSSSSREAEESEQVERAEPANYAQQAAYIWKNLPMPVITAIHGVAYGGGAQIALGGDIRIAAPDIKLSLIHI